MKKDKKTGGRVKGTPNKTVGTIDNAEPLKPQWAAS